MKKTNNLITMAIVLAMVIKEFRKSRDKFNHSLYKKKKYSLLVQLISGLSIVVGILITAHIAWFYIRSNQKGSSLVKSISQRNSSVLAQCSNTQNKFTSGLLQIPSIKLIAPVIKGTNNPQLNIAVGYLPTSSPPGKGTTLLAAHNVSWFVNISKLHPGNIITYSNSCHTFLYKVTGAKVVQQGTPVFNVSHPRLVLETCYPTDALFLTSKRLLVSAELIDIKSPSEKTIQNPNQSKLKIKVPLALKKQGLSLQNNPTPLGRLTIVGTPNTNWSQSPAPLQAANEGDKLYFAVLRTLKQQNTLWWSQIAPTVPYSTVQALQNATIIHYNRSLSSTLNVSGNKVISESITTSIKISNGVKSSNYMVNLQEVVSGNILKIIAFRLVPN